MGPARFLSFLGATLLPGGVATYGHGALDGSVVGVGVDISTALTIDADGICTVFGGPVFIAEAETDASLETVYVDYPMEADSSIAHLNIDNIQVTWYNGGDSFFTLADALSTASIRNEYGRFAIHSGQLHLMAGDWPPDFQ